MKKGTSIRNSRNNRSDCFKRKFFFSWGADGHELYVYQNNGDPETGKGYIDSYSVVDQERFERETGINIGETMENPSKELINFAIEKSPILRKEMNKKCKI